VKKMTEINSIDFKLGQHIYWVYETEEEFKSVLLQFIKGGFQNFEKVLYLFDSGNDSFEIAQSVYAEIRDRNFHEKDYFECVCTDDVYSNSTNFDPENALNWIKNQVESALVAGFSGLRICADMSWLINKFQDPELLVDYESRVNNFILNSRVIGLCQYYRKIFPPKLLNQLIDTHPQIIIGTMFLENMYFTDPSKFLKPEREEALLQKRLENIVEMNSQRMEIAQRNTYQQQLIEKTTKDLDASLIDFSLLYDSAPIAIWEEDCSEISTVIQSLQYHSQSELESYFEENKEFVLKTFARRKILNANAYTYEISKTNNRDDLEKKITSCLLRNIFFVKSVFLGMAANQKNFQGYDFSIEETGIPLYFDLLGTVFPGHEKDYSRIVVFMTNTTERRSLWEDLRLNESRLTEAQELSKMGSLEFISRKNKCLCSEEFIRILERDGRKKELTIREVTSHLPENEYQILREKVLLALTTNAPVQYETSFISGKGRKKYGIVSIKNYQDPVTANQRIFGTLMDVTEQRVSSQSLARSEEKYKKLIENSLEAIVMTDSQGQITEWNEAAEKMYQLSKNEVEGKYIWDVQSAFVYTKKELSESGDYKKTVIEKMLMGTQTGSEKRPFLSKIKLPDGSVREINSVVYTLETEEGTVLCSISNDVTDKRLEERSLAESEERYRLLSEVGSDCAYTLIYPNDGSVYCDWVTGTFKRVIGWTIDEMDRQGSFPSIVHPEDLKIYFSLRDKSLRGELNSGEYRIISEAGEIKWLRDTRKPVWDKEIGRVTKVYGAITDITDRKLTELAIQESENRLRTTFEAMPIGVIYTDAHGNIVYSNKSASHILGKEIGEAKQAEFLSDSHPLIYENGEKIPFEELPTIKAFRTREVVKDFLMGVFNHVEERYRWVLISAVPQIHTGDEDPFQVCALIQDITRIEDANLALEESEARFRTLIEKSPIAIGITRSGITTYANQRFLEMFGYDELNEINGESALKLIAPEEHGKVNEIVSLWNQGQIKTAENEIMGIRKDGSRFPYSSAVTEVDLPDGLAHIGYFVDITARKRAEELLQETSQFLNTLITASPLAIIGLDLNKKVIFWTPSAEKLFGWEFREVIYRELPTIPDNLIHEFNTIFDQVILSSPVMNYETLRKHKNGKLIEVSISNSALRNTNGEIVGVMVILVDISIRKMTERELEKSFEDLQSLSSRILTIQEEERTRISREIHDELGQNLTGIKMDVFRIKKQIGKLADESSVRFIQENLLNVIHLVDETINTVRRIATDLRPSVLDNLGIVPAIEWLSSDFQDRSGIKCTFVSTLGITDIDPAAATTLFRICQEALTNVMRHAHATEVKITLDWGEDNIYLTVADNGIGLHEKDIQGQSLGILGMKERIMIIGGTLSIKSGDLVGTILKAAIPVEMCRKGNSENTDC
jgi:PAS domain S-box-containing protein